MEAGGTACRWRCASPTSITGDAFRAGGRETLTGVPENVAFAPAEESSVFIGALFSKSSSCNVFKLGVLRGE